MTIMKKLISVLAFFSFLSSACCYISFRPMPEFGNESLELSVRLAVHKDGRHLYASGFAVDKDFILTAGHFCKALLSQFAEGDFEIEYDYFNGEEIKKGGTIEHIYALEDTEDADYCLLKKENHGIEALRFRKGNLSIGQKVMTVGAPGGLFPVRTYGEVINSYVPLYDLGSYFPTTIRVEPGNSGGPILDQGGHVVGMMIGYLKKYRGISFSFPSNKIINILKENKVGYTYGGK